MLRGELEVALLRYFDDLWLLGDEPMAFPRLDNSPNSVGAEPTWHFCADWLAPCNWLGERPFRGVTAAV